MSLAFAVAVMALCAFAPSAFAWHFSGGTAECLQKVGDQCRTKVTVTAVGFSSPATITVGKNSYQANFFTEDATGNTQTGQAGYGQPTTFVNGINTFEVLVPCNLVKLYVIKHKDQSGATKVALNYDVPACKDAPPPPPPTPPVVTTESAKPSGKTPVNKVNMHMSTKCVKKVGYKVFGTHIVKVRWYVHGKYYKTTKGPHYIKRRAHKVVAKVYFEDGSIVTIPNRYDLKCGSPRFTG